MKFFLELHYGTRSLNLNIYIIDTECPQHTTNNLINKNADINLLTLLSPF